MVSSLAAGGPGTLRPPRREADPEQPVSAYGRSKLAAEQARPLRRPATAPLSIVRPPMVFGQGDRASLQLFRSMKFLPGASRARAAAISAVARPRERSVRCARRASRTRRARHRHGADGRPPRGGRNTTSPPIAPSPTANSANWPPRPPAGPSPSAAAAAHLLARRRASAKRWAASAAGRRMLNFDKVRESDGQRLGLLATRKSAATLGYQPAATLEERFAETVAWYREHGWL